MLQSLPIHLSVALLLGLTGVNISLYQEILAPRVLTVQTLGVGKGAASSAILVRTKSGAAILIDTGPDASILRTLGEALPPWQRSLDAVILTSEKRDSVGGLPDLLSRYKVKQEITLHQSAQLHFDDGTYIYLTLRKNAPVGVSISDGVSLTKIR